MHKPSAFVRAIACGVALGAMAIVVVPSADSAGKEYSNAEYGYAFAIPDAVEVAKTDPQAPDHGVRMNLTNDGRSILWVDGSYNALDWQTPTDVVNANLEFLKDDGATDISVTRQGSAGLGSLSGTDLLVSFTSAGRPSVLHVVVALRQPAKADAPGIVYTVGLQTSKDRSEADGALFDAVVHSFRELDVPKSGG